MPSFSKHGFEVKNVLKTHTHTMLSVTVAVAASVQCLKTTISKNTDTLGRVVQITPF